MKTNYQELKKNILEELEKDYPEYKEDEEIGYDADKSLDQIFAKSVKGLVNFDLVFREDGERWLQVEYFSKLEKTIILDYDCPIDFLNIDEFADWLVEKQQEVDKLEDDIVSLETFGKLKEAVSKLLFVIRENKSSAQTGKNDFEEVIKTKFIESELETLRNLIK